MTVASRIYSCILVLALCCLLTACSGGGGGAAADGPEIGTINTTMALAGQTVVVNGTGFGTSQGTSSLTLNGLAFTVASWTSTRIEATVPTGATSGTVTVTVGDRSSTGGAGAQLEVRSVLPVLTAVTPDGADREDTVVLTGTNFGDTACLVVFANTNGAELEATVISWSDTSAEVLVPGLTTGEASVALGINTWRSDTLDFFCTGGSGTATLLITSVYPTRGAIGSTVTIRGQLFGDEQGTSSLRLGDVAMEIVSWADGMIEARVPEGAASGLIRLTVPPFPELVWQASGIFEVGGQPEITAFDPGQIVIGQPVAIYGKNFGTSRGQVTIGGKTQHITGWEPYGADGYYRVVIEEVLPFSATPVTQEDGIGHTITDQFGLPVEYYEIVVSTDDGLDSPAVLAPRGTGLEATINVDRTIGQRSESGLDNGTVFSFSAEVTGGSGDYSLVLTPDTGNPGTISDNYNYGTETLEYIYPYSAAAPDQENIETRLRVMDETTGDYTNVPGPELFVVNYGVPFIASMGVRSFNFGGYDAPNPICYHLPTGFYGGFSFGTDMHFTSWYGTVAEADGTPLEKYTRDLGSYMIDGDHTRPLGYRYYTEDGLSTTDGAIITVRGVNFGDEPGTVQLNATGGHPAEVSHLAPATDLPTGWSDSEIRFYLPGAMLHLSGTVRVIPAGSTSGPYADSPVPLTCSPYIVDVTPDSDLYTGNDVVTLTGFDLRPSQVADSVGDETYSIWYVPIRYVDPWTTLSTTSYGLLTNPVPASAIGATVVMFTLADLDLDQDGVVQAEVFNASGSESIVVDAELANGDYSFFLWTSALADGTPEEITNSGIFSEQYTLTNCEAGPAGNRSPSANLQATPTTGTPPLEVSFDGSASTDDTAIVNYEWDFDGNSSYSESAEELAAVGSPGPHVYTFTEAGNYVARLRVTDDEGQYDVDYQVITVTDTAEEYTITLNVYVDDFESYSATSQTLARLYDGDPTTGGAAIAQYALDHVAAGAGNPATCVFDELDAGDVYYIRLQTPVIHWDGDAEPEPIRDFGPYAVPPNAVVDIYGTQYQEPPLPS